MYLCFFVKVITYFRTFTSHEMDVKLISSIIVAGLRPKRLSQLLYSLQKLKFIKRKSKLNLGSKILDFYIKLEFQL